MTFPIPVTYAPMEARSVASLPKGDGWQFEPKWDGFRCLAFKNKDSVELRSKSGQSLTRYFPEVAGALRRLGAATCVVDGEIVVPENDELSFDALLQRIHPAASRVDRLARETPACFVVFDLLVDERGTDLTDVALRERRSRLERFFTTYMKPAKGFELSPSTREREAAEEWLSGHAGTDGVIAKKLDEPYCTGERSAMQKIKRIRTAECVIGGFRYASKGKLIGSLLLGLYEDGVLHHCGFTSSFTAVERVEVTKKVERLAGGVGFTGRAPGGPSRWASERSAEWIAVKPVLVCEVQYDHWSNERFRHGTKLLRWRPDKRPRDCTFEQIRTRGTRKGGVKSPFPRKRSSIRRARRATS